MGRLEKYLSEDDILLEKVSKKEIEITLNNPRIRVGVEFEFIMTNIDIESMREEWEDYRNMYDDWFYYSNSLEDFNQKYDEWEYEYKRCKKDKEYLDNNYDGDILHIENEEPVPPEVPSYAIHDIQPGEYLSEPERPERPYPDDIEFEDMVDMGLPLDKLPFKVRVYGDYHEGERGKNWILEPDSSLPTNGAELISPILTMKEFLHFTPIIFDFINDYGATTNDCGLHINMSINGVDNIKDTLDPVKLILFTDEGLIWKYFSEKSRSRNAASMLKGLKKGYVDRNLLRNLMNVKKLDNKIVDSGHYMGINLENLNRGEHGRVEFRYMGGNVYHKKWDKIKQLVANYAFALSVGVDPEYKKKEYIHKLSRIMNKVELVRKKRQLTRSDHRDKLTSDQIKILEKEISQLEKIYKISTEEYISIDRWIYQNEE